MTTRFISFNEEKEKNHLWKSGLHLINHSGCFGGNFLSIILDSNIIG